MTGDLPGTECLRAIAKAIFDNGIQASDQVRALLQEAGKCCRRTPSILEGTSLLALCLLHIQSLRIQIGHDVALITMLREFRSQIQLRDRRGKGLTGGHQQSVIAQRWHAEAVHDAGLILIDGDGIGRAVHGAHEIDQFLPLHGLIHRRLPVAARGLGGLVGRDLGDQSRQGRFGGGKLRVPRLDGRVGEVRGRGRDPKWQILVPNEVVKEGANICWHFGKHSRTMVEHGASRAAIFL